MNSLILTMSAGGYPHATKSMEGMEVNAVRHHSTQLSYQELASSNWTSESLTWTPCVSSMLRYDAGTVHRSKLRLGHKKEEQTGPY
jgi:hypothetical protein